MSRLPKRRPNAKLQWIYRGTPVKLELDVGLVASPNTLGESFRRSPILAVDATFNSSSVI